MTLRCTIQPNSHLRRYTNQLQFLKYPNTLPLPTNFRNSSCQSTSPHHLSCPITPPPSPLRITTLRFLTNPASNLPQPPTKLPPPTGPPTTVATPPTIRATTPLTTLPRTPKTSPSISPQWPFRSPQAPTPEIWVTTTRISPTPSCSRRWTNPSRPTSGPSKIECGALRGWLWRPTPSLWASRPPGRGRASPSPYIQVPATAFIDIAKILPWLIIFWILMNQRNKFRGLYVLNRQHKSPDSDPRGPQKT